jgi:hypothetical protein
MATPGRAYTLNSIDVSEIVIYNFTTKSFMDLRNVAVEFSVYEDLFSNFMSAEITVQDTSSLIETLPIVGEEFIKITFNTPTFDSKVSKVFYVYKIEEKKSMNERTDVYTIGMVSVESIISLSSSVSKSYTGYPISYIVETVFNEYILNSKKKFGQSEEYSFNLSEKGILIEDTFDSHSFVGYGQTPFEFLNYLATESRTLKHKESDFIFYEDKDSFNFRTISNLMEQDPVESFYLADPAREDRETEVKQYQIIQNLEWVDQFDVIERHASGMYDNTVAVIDPILKRYQESYFNYTDGFKELKHLGKAPVSTNYSHFSKLKTGDTHTRFLVGNISSDDYSQTSYLKNRTENDPFIQYPFIKHKVLNHRVSKISQLINSIRCNISVPGNTDVKVGDVINVFIPENRASEESKAKYNYFIGDVEPKFLVTAVTHRYSYNEDQYFTIMEVVKDSYAKPIKDNSQ